MKLENYSANLRLCKECGTVKYETDFNNRQRRCKECQRIYDHQYYLTHKEKINKRTAEYAKKREQNDINFRLLRTYRHRVRNALKSKKKDIPTRDLIGCTIDELRSHLESQFRDGMAWDNYGKWHIDHIIPCSAFDLSKEEELKRCFHFSNLQPLWAKENLRKADKIGGERHGSF